MPILSQLRKTENAALGVGGVTYYNTLDSLPITGLTSGDQAFVSATERYYVSDGNGWFNTTLINKNIRWDSGGEPSAEAEITDSATPLIIIARAADSDQANFLNQSLASDSAQYIVDITNDSSVWTFTPKSADSIGIEVAAGNLPDSDGDFVYTFKWSDGLSFVNKAVTITYNPSGGGGAFSWGGDRGLSIFYGNTQIDYWSIVVTSQTGADFGDMPYNQYYMGADISNGSRCCFTGGHVSNNDTISYVTSSTTGNAQDFGDMTRGNFGTANASNGTRGIMAGGANPPNDVGQGYDGTEYITIATTGNGTTFGTLAASREHPAGASDGTYMGICGGQNPFKMNNIDRMAFMTSGNATDFGDLTWARRFFAGHGNGNRVTMVGGEDDYNGGVGTGYGNDIDTFVLTTPGNATFFGEVGNNTADHGCTGNADYGAMCGGVLAWDPGGTTYSTITRWSMATTGNGSDIGNLAFARKIGAAVSGAAS